MDPHRLNYEEEKEKQEMKWDNRKQNDAIHKIIGEPSPLHNSLLINPVVMVGTTMTQNGIRTHMGKIGVEQIA